MSARVASASVTGQGAKGVPRPTPRARPGGLAGARRSQRRGAVLPRPLTTHWSRRQQPPLVPRCGSWRGSPRALGPAGVRHTSKTGRHPHLTTGTDDQRAGQRVTTKTGQDSGPRQAKTADQDRPRQAKTIGQDNRPRQKNSPATAFPTSGVRGYRVWDGTGQGRGAVRGLTNACT